MIKQALVLLVLCPKSDPLYLVYSRCESYTTSTNHFYMVGRQIRSKTDNSNRVNSRYNIRNSPEIYVFYIVKYFIWINHLEAHKIISIEQHVFVSSKAYVTNLLECQDITTSALHDRIHLESSIQTHEGI